MQTLKGRTCIIAGGSGGDGTETVRALCRAGMNVVMMTHQPSQADDLITSIRAEGYPEKVAACLDGSVQDPPVSDAEVFRHIYEEYGSIDVLVANTGADGFEDSIDSVTPELMIKEVSALLGKSHSMLYYCLPYLRLSKAPRVIFMTSVEGERGGVLESYTNAVAKGAVLALARNSAARLAAEGITVNCIKKGLIQRQLHVSKHPDEKKPKDTSVMLDHIPSHKAGTPADLAEAICFLASEESGYVTGAVIDLSGGLSLL